MHSKTVLQHYFFHFPKFSSFMCSQPPTRLFCLPLFPHGPPLLLSLSLSLPPRCLSAFSLTHTLFPLHSLLQSKYYLTSSQRLSTSQQRFSTAALLPPCLQFPCCCSGGHYWAAFSRLQQSPVLYACSGYSAVSWIKNKQGGIHCSRRKVWEGLQWAEIYSTPLLVRLSDKRPLIVSLCREIAACRSQGVLIKPRRKFVVQQQAMKGIS